MPDLKDFLQPKEIPEDKKKEYDQKFKELKDDLESNERMFNDLHNYFSSKKYSPQVISKHYDTYWKWYVELTWDNYYNFDEKTFLDTFLHQLPTMTALGIDVTKKFMNYFTFNLEEENERESFFQDVKGRINNLDYPINFSLENSLGIDELLKFYSRRDDKDNLEEADFYSKVREQLFSEDNKLAELESEEQRSYITGLFETLFFIKNQDRIHPTAQSYNLNLSGFYDWVNNRAQELSQQGNRGKVKEKQESLQVDKDQFTAERSIDSEQTAHDSTEADGKAKSQKEEGGQNRAGKQQTEGGSAPDQSKPRQEQSSESVDNKTKPSLEKQKKESRVKKNKQQQAKEQPEGSTETVADVLDDGGSDPKDDADTSGEEKQEEPITTKEEDDKQEVPKKEQESSQQDKKDTGSSELKQAKQNVKKHQDMSIEEIKKEVEAQFGKLKELEPENIEAFKKVLRSVARQQDREDEVENWFYFDSESSSFKWNDDYFNN
ncbi:MAG: hypothetical protein ABEJ02_01950 [Candidatus Paceibacteria bacterium]